MGTECSDSGNQSDFAKYADQYLSFFRVFCHASWKDELIEDIEFAEDGSWHVNSELHLNLNRLKSFKSPSLSEDGLKGRVPTPLFELSKDERNLHITVTNGAGSKLKVAPNEGSLFFEWMVLMGLIVNAHNVGIIDRSEMQPPSRQLEKFMRAEIRRFSAPVYKNSFIEEFEARLKKHDADNCILAIKGVFDEWVSLKEHVPGFASLFTLFAMRWVPVIYVDVTDHDNEILNVKFDEHFDFDPCERTIEKDDFGKFTKADKDLIDKGYVLTCPLRRVHAAESEQFWIHGPKWTFFMPFSSEELYEPKKNSSNSKTSSDKHSKEDEFCVFIDRSNAYKGNKKPVVSVEGMLDADKLFLRTSSIWNGQSDATHRRFDIPEDPSQVKKGRSVDWGKHAGNDIHSYAVELRWAAKPMRRGRAMRAFIATSTIAVSLLAIIVGFGDLGSFYASRLNDLSGFLTALCVAVPLLALAFSNLQEELTYYRAILMKIPTSWVRCGIVCDCVAYILTFIMSFFHTFLAIRIFNAIALVLIACLLGRYTCKIHKWVKANEINAVDWKTSHPNAVSKITVHCVSNDEVNPKNSGQTLES